MRLVTASTLLSAAAAFAPRSPVRTPRTTSLDASKCGGYDFDVIIVGCGVGGHGAALHARAQDLSTAVFVRGGRGRHVREPRLRPVEGPPGGVRPRAGDAGRVAPVRVRHHGGRRGEVRPRGGGGPREAAGQPRQGQPRGEPRGPERGHRGRPGGPDGRAARGEGRELRQGLHGQGHRPRAGLRALRPAGRGGRREDRVHLRRRPRAAERARVGRHRRLRLHRPRVQRRLHRARVGGHLHRGPAQHHAHLRQGDRQAGREAAHPGQAHRLPDQRLRQQGHAGDPGREAGHHRDDRRGHQVSYCWEHVETLEVDAAMVATGRVPNTANMGLEDAGIETSRGFVAVDEKMRVLTSHGEGSSVVPHVYCIGDANGKMMLAHAASAQGISAIENICGREHAVNHDAIPAACFTHPEIAMVGPTEEQARERAEKEGWTLGKSTGSFRANSKALAELEGNGMAKCLFKEETGEVVAVHIIGIHAADLIQECSNAVAAGTTVQELSMMVHTHPTLCEVLDEAFKGAVGMAAH
ncbi:hypothetical protein THAOC_19934 [Thalassiosira oceanica]|uniref:Dihydrolipoyl dehydrogenase n=2 Tax=Thalassiosira oceanica TaxID=159749 RepID=K0SMV9_THAOC|nr:hypothetical protein THAOC_19934 [Thalassiosira oceanica]|eukprot:EJK59802.1 hypothetical protein THAOC_19934 [Thalassiosira oceanica]